MKKLILFFAILSSPCWARGGGTSIPACSASPPSQASGVSINRLVLCDTFATNNGVDIGGTFSSGFHLYPQSVYKTYPITPFANISNDGTGLSVSGSGGNSGGPTNSGKTFQTAGPNVSSPYYTGLVLTGSFYAEIDMRFSPVTPAGQVSGNAPAFWFQNVNRYIGFQNSINIPPSVEVDVFEALPGTQGQNISFNSQFHHWRGTPSQNTIDCSSNSGSNAPADYTIYNTYGVLVLAAADNGGTGLVKTYVNNVLSLSCSYNSGGVISCNSGISGTCDAGDLYELDSAQQSVLMIGSGYPTWPEQVRNFHVWQK